MSLITSVASSSPAGVEHQQHQQQHQQQTAPSAISLSIGQQDALDMIEASRAFNQRLVDIKARSTNAVVAGNDDDDAVLATNMIEAASTCTDPLVQTFYRSLRQKSSATIAEIQASLILFLDTDKSTKLLTAFGIFHHNTRTTATHDNNNNNADIKMDEDFQHVKQQQQPTIKVEQDDNEKALLPSSSNDHLLLDSATNATNTTAMEITQVSTSQDAMTSKQDNSDDLILRLDQAGIQSMFTCFLTALSMCIRDQRTSTAPDDDNTTIELSKEKEIEIRNICSYAAAVLVSTLSSSSATTLEDDDDKKTTKTEITYEDFGEWYNEGGFELVPWLELLALSKWDHGCFTTSSSKSPPMLSASISSSPPASSTAASSSAASSSTNKNNSITTTQNSKCVVSFDFTGVSCDKPLHIDITEENLLLLKKVVTRTGLFRKSPHEMCQVILKHAGGATIQKNEFGRCMRELIAGTNLTPDEIINFSNFLVGLFSCFDRQVTNVVNAKELAAGLSFLSGGNKSNKLAIAFELLDEHQEGRLTRENLTRFLRSFLAVIVGISMPTSRLSREDMFLAVDNGASWTQSHVLSTPNKSSVTFDEFAEWYTEGGYTVAPWLELLDLSKFISLLDGESTTPYANTGAVNTNNVPIKHTNNGYVPITTTTAAAAATRVGHSQHPPKEVLFTFPLANENELVVLKDDVFYVRSVVDQLGLIMVRPEDVWTSLCKNAASVCFASWTGAYEVDQNTFVNAVDNSVATLTGRSLDRNSKFTLSNFFSSYDLEQFNKVHLNQLMGGLALFCLGRKSAKLAFSFGLFDGRNNINNAGGSSNHPIDPSKKGEAGAALNGDELFLFLRSFLIVLFSCCAQSLELTSDGVSLWIHDTSKMVCGNVMRFQWNAGKRCVNFDDFGIWYNQGGFEVAPWLELLDLNKWFLGQQRPSHHHPHQQQSHHNKTQINGHYSTAVSAADSELHAPIMDSPMGDFAYDFAGEFEQIIGQHDEKENFTNNTTSITAPPSSRGGEDLSSSSSSLTFQLLTNDRDPGVMISITQVRVTSLRQLLTESGFFRMEAIRFCSRLILYSDKASGALSKDQYDNAMRSIVAEIGVSMSSETQQRLSDLLTALFYAFDREKRSKVDAVEFAAGMTVLCGGRKSDKLEYAFELIDDDRDGKLSRQGLWRFLRSFLTVLVSLSSPDNVMKDERTISAVDSGASWAVSQAFGPESNSRLISFDDFAAWYTKGGYGIIPWLELLDLKKWVVLS